MQLLTNKEVLCLQWAAAGKTSKEIGLILSRSEHTINFHINNACRKLGVYGRQAAISAAWQAGLLPTEQPAGMGPSLPHPTALSACG